MDRQKVAKELLSVAKLLAEEMPDDVVGDFTINVHREDNGTYMVSCREWRTEFPAGKTAAKVSSEVKKLVDQIVKHNDSLIALW